jgi:DNA-binding CsgD family transcriptional regulator
MTAFAEQPAVVARDEREPPAELPARFAAFANDASAHLPYVLPRTRIVDANVDPAQAFVTAVAVLCVDELSTSAPVAEPALLIDLALRAADLIADLRQHERTRRSRALADVGEALRRLRRSAKPDELVSELPRLVVDACGFSRSMLSRVIAGAWVPWLAHFGHRPVSDSDRTWMASATVPLNAMPLERDVVLQRRSAFVADVAADDRTSPAFVAATGTRSYAVAPIVLGDNVIGLLHADHYPATLPVDRIDLHILEMLADGFSRLYERAVLLERLHDARDHVRAAFSEVETMIDDLVSRDIELVRTAEDRSSSAAIGPGSSEIDELLTAREREVMAMLVTGQTNHAIASQLVISEGTVKSHVKQILRKTGSSNRAEVIGRYLGVASCN